MHLEIAVRIADIRLLFRFNPCHTQRRMTMSCPKPLPLSVRMVRASKGGRGRGLRDFGEVQTRRQPRWQASNSQFQVPNSQFRVFMVPFFANQSRVQKRKAKTGNLKRLWSHFSLIASDPVP